MISEIQGLSISINKKVINIFSNFIQNSTSKNEAGGIILGKVSKDFKQVKILKASVPTQLDRQGRFHFFRNRNWAQQIVDYEYFNSDGEIIYLGEWHTHPSILARPSSQDLKMISTQFQNNSLNTPWIFLIIVSRSEIFLGLQSETGLISSKKTSFKEGGIQLVL